MDTVRKQLVRIALKRYGNIHSCGGRVALKGLFHPRGRYHSVPVQHKRRQHAARFVAAGDNRGPGQLLRYAAQ